MSTQPHPLGRTSERPRTSANSYLIGADPEFAILDSEGQVVPVIAPRETPSLTNPLGVSTSFPNGKLGFDHGGRVIELRPDPSLHASDLLADIQRTLSRRELWPYRKFKWKAGALAGNDTLGGHIHFDLPISLSQNVPIWVRALDSVTRLLEGIDILPRQESAVRRNGAYGRFGDVRGSGRRPDGVPRLEYRTPASWLFSPHTTLFCLTALKLALVDPAHTLGVFEVSPRAPITCLKRFIRGFAKADSDAREITEAIEADGNRLTRFRGDPSADLKAAWQLPEVTAAELASIPAPVETSPLRPGQMIPMTATEMTALSGFDIDPNARMLAVEQAQRMAQAQVSNPFVNAAQGVMDWSSQGISQSGALETMTIDEAVQRMRITPEQAHDLQRRAARQVQFFRYEPLGSTR